MNLHDVAAGLLSYALQGGLLSKAAVEAVRQWTFKPALCDGRPVGVFYDLTIKFHLN